MPAPCQYCSEPVRLSKDNYREQHMKVDGVWTVIYWHTACDPFSVKVKVTNTAPRGSERR